MKKHMMKWMFAGVLLLSLGLGQSIAQQSVGCFDGVICPYTMQEMFCTDYCPCMGSPCHFWTNEEYGYCYFGCLP